MEIKWTPKPTPKALENSPTVLSMLQARGDTAIAALDTILMQLRQLTQQVGQLQMDLRKFDDKVGLPTDPAARKAAMLDSVRRTRPDLASLTDAQLLETIRKTPR